MYSVLAAGTGYADKRAASGPVPETVPTYFRCSRLYPSPRYEPMRCNPKYTTHQSYTLSSFYYFIPRVISFVLIINRKIQIQVVITTKFQISGYSTIYYYYFSVPNLKHKIGSQLLKVTTTYNILFKYYYSYLKSFLKVYLFIWLHHWVPLHFCSHKFYLVTKSNLDRKCFVLFVG